jgi:hypothetical protein
LLDQELQTAKGLVIFGAVGCRTRGAEGPGALVRIFIAGGKVPRVKQWIGRGFFKFVRNDARHSVAAPAAIWSNRLEFAIARTSERITHERELNIDAADCGIGVPAAILGAESSGLVDVRSCQDEVNSIDVQGQVVKSGTGSHVAFYHSFDGARCAEIA